MIWEGFMLWSKQKAKGCSPSPSHPLSLRSRQMNRLKPTLLTHCCEVGRSRTGTQWVAQTLHCLRADTEDSMSTLCLGRDNGE